MRSINLSTRRGSGMVLAFFAIMLVFALGVSYLSVTTSSLVAARRDVLRSSALAAAEAGVDAAIARLMAKEDGALVPGTFRTKHPSSDPDDHDSDSDKLESTLSPGITYSVCVRDGAGIATGKVVITSTGASTSQGATARQTIKAVVNVKVENIGVWNNAIFAGTGQAGKSINGNVQIRGSVHILGDGEDFTDLDHDGVWDDAEPYIDLNHNGHWDPGEPYTDLDGDGQYDFQEPFVDVNGNGTRDPALTITDFAGDFGGNACVGNNYDCMPAGLRSLVPDPPKVMFNGRLVESLSAVMRVKHGQIGLSGSASVGMPDVPGSSVKETLDGVYVTDGFGGSDSSVHTDNGTSHAYDLGDDAVDLPIIGSGSYTKGGVTYTNYLEYLNKNAAVVTGDLSISKGTALNITDPLGRGRLTVDVNGNMHIEGVVYVAGNITIGPGKSTIIYDGSGSLVTPGDAYVHANLLPKTKFATSDCLGLIAGKNVELATGGGDAQLTMAIAMYAQRSIISNKQNEVAGTMVTSYFQMSNVPRLYQVPELWSHLPPGMPGSDPILIAHISVDSWQQVAN